LRTGRAADGVVVLVDAVRAVVHDPQVRHIRRVNE
jgi:hypothetical protein